MKSRFLVGLVILIALVILIVLGLPSLRQLKFLSTATPLPSSFKPLALSGQAQQLIEEAKQSAPEAYQYTVDQHAQFLSTVDQRSYYVQWFPAGADMATLPVLVTIHGQGSRAVDDFRAWQPYMAERGYGLIAIEWWYAGNADGDGYYDAEAVYAIAVDALRRVGTQPGKVLWQGFSRGGPMIYFVAALDRTHNQYGKVVIASSGTLGPKSRERLIQTFGKDVFRDTHWAMFCGEVGAGVMQADCGEWYNARDWLKDLGAQVPVIIVDPEAGHGGFYTDQRYMNKTLSVFDNYLKQR